MARFFTPRGLVRRCQRNRGTRLGDEGRTDAEVVCVSDTTSVHRFGWASMDKQGFAWPVRSICRTGGHGTLRLGRKPCSMWATSSAR